MPTTNHTAQAPTIRGCVLTLIQKQLREVLPKDSFYCCSIIHKYKGERALMYALGDVVIIDREDTIQVIYESYVWEDQDGKKHRARFPGEITFYNISDVEQEIENHFSKETIENYQSI